MVPSSPLQIAVATLPPIAVLGLILYVVRAAPEPWSRVVASFLAGLAAFAAAQPIELAIAPYIPPTWVGVWAFGVVAPVEELLKTAAVPATSGRPTRYARLSSGLTYAIATAAGFALAENLAYVATHGTTTGLVRAVTAVPSHGLHSACAGLGLGLVSQVRGIGRRIEVIALGLVAAIGFHGVYDAVLLVGGAWQGGAAVVLVAEALIVRGAIRRALASDKRRDVDALARLPLLSSVSTRSLRRLAEGSSRLRVRQGALAVRQGRFGDALFVILRGTFEVQRGSAMVRRLRRGDFFGERAVLTGRRRSADVRASRASLLLRVPRATLLRAIHGDAELALGIAREAKARFGAESVPSAAELLAEAARVEAAGVAEGLDARLRAVPLLSRLAPQDLSKLSRACEMERRRASSRLTQKGGYAPGLCVLLSGQAEVRVAPESVPLAEGDFYGEISLLTGWAPNASVDAITPVEQAVLHWEDLEPVLAASPRLGWDLLDALRNRSNADAARPRPTFLRRVWHRLNRRLLSADHETDELYQQFPELVGLPWSVVDTVRRFELRHAVPEGHGRGPSDGSAAAEACEADELVEPDQSLMGWTDRYPDMLDAIARCPRVLQFLARLILRRHQTLSLPKRGEGQTYW